MGRKSEEEVDIRYTPEIRVKLDNSMENAIKITKLLRLPKFLHYHIVFHHYLKVVKY